MSQNKSGKLVAIEGLDGAGKSTQIQLLTESFTNRNEKVKFIHFPRLEVGVFGDLISKFLQGKFGKLEVVHPQLVALLYAEDRRDFAPTLQSWLDSGYHVLVDRYVFSNIAYQCAKLTSKEEKENLISWIYHIEYEIFKIPKPHISFFLDVPFSFTKSTLEKARTGDERNYLKGKIDIHEANLTFQEKVKMEYDSILENFTDISRINCFTEDQKIKSKASIHEEIVKLLSLM